MALINCTATTGVVHEKYDNHSPEHVLCERRDMRTKIEVEAQDRFRALINLSSIARM